MTDNVLLLTIDSLAIGHLSCYDYPLPTSPNLEALADRHTWFQQCTAQSSHTRESMPSLFASEYPLAFDCMKGLQTDRPTLATVLSSAGFATAGFHSNPYLSRAYGFDRGFDTFYDSLRLSSSRIVTFAQRALNYLRTEPYVRADTLNERYLDWLDRTDAERTFGWIHYMDPHGPYQPPADYQRLFRDEPVGKRRAKQLWRKTIDQPGAVTPSERKILVDLYDAEIRYTDRMISDLVAALKARDRFQETLVVLAADHGEAFMQRDVFGHPRQLYDELVHVPLLFMDGSESRINEPVENVDIAPTILERVGEPVPDAFSGRSLSPSANLDSRLTVSDRPVTFSHARGEGSNEGTFQVAVRSPTHAYVATIDEDGNHLSEDLRSRQQGTQPETTTDSAILRKAFRDTLKTHLDGFNLAVDMVEPDKVDQSVQERLRDLGYQEK